MRIGRRGFLSASMGLAASGLPLGPPDFFRRGETCLAPTGELKARCALLDLREGCALPESLAGYKEALAGARVAFSRLTPGDFAGFQRVIVPACAVIDSDLARHLSASLREGVNILLESGGGFLDPRQFNAHRELLRSHFGLEVESPVDLWTGAALGQRVPYVDYTWPLPTKTRDFSRVVPVAAQAGEVIGRIGNLSTALRRKVGKGTLIFLGSPLGPQLLAGDAEARRWFNQVLAMG